MTALKKPAVRNAHDYISINFGQGRVFTLNRNGAKGTNLPGAVFTRLDNFVQAEVKKPGGDYGKAVEALVAQIDRVWAAWNEPVPTFAVGDSVVDFVGKKGTVVGKVRLTTRCSSRATPTLPVLAPPCFGRRDQSGRIREGRKEYPMPTHHQLLVLVSCLSRRVHRERYADQARLSALFRGVATIRLPRRQGGTGCHRRGDDGRRRGRGQDELPQLLPLPRVRRGVG